MIGAIIGDIVGSRFEWNNHRSKDFDLFGEGCFATDDSIMTVAVAKAVTESGKDYDLLEKNAVKYMVEIGRKYPNCGYGGRFNAWLFADEQKPYNSYGNGAAMRVSACGFAAETQEEVVSLARAVTVPTHNHREGLKGAEATAMVIFWARNGRTKAQIREEVEKLYYKLDFTLDGIRDSYEFNETCMETVPQAIEAFLESNGFEDAIRNAISIGGDSDTVAAITGGMAEAYYGVPSDIRKTAMSYLDKGLREIVVEFEKKYSSTKMYQSVIEFMRKDEENFSAGILYDLLQHSFMTDYSHGHNLKNALKKQGKKEIEELDFSKLSLREIFGALDGIYSKACSLAYPSQMYSTGVFASIADRLEQLDKSPEKGGFDERKYLHIRNLLIAACDASAFKKNRLILDPDEGIITFYAGANNLVKNDVRLNAGSKLETWTYLNAVIKNKWITIYEPEYEHFYIIFPDERMKEFLC